ncbi:MAG: hypothetical protein FJ271_28120 [Planctomycetes bacterium]|nr:hypothetical protein [Planctomycetota bacterium]
MPCAASKKNVKNYPPGWCLNDLVADPRFQRFAESDSPADFRLEKDSPARGKGIVLPADWADPLRPKAGRPDIGALPFGADAPTFGRRGRITSIMQR